ncbi:MAG TPA: efflux RND transporter periplasmic adaptor subunit [Rhizomicrobium sp.]|nr:efflux RND transporter periplasmic adaptor subunit [Rhizomicrobium sp.]
MSEFIPSVSRNANASRTSSRSRLLWGALIVAVLGGAAYFGWGFLFPQHKRTPPPAPVRTAIAKRQDVTVIQHTVGTVVSPDMLAVTAQVTGMLMKANFQEGQLVKKGDPLFEIDPRPFEAALAQAQGQLAKDQSTLTGARVDLKRYQTLLGANAISKQTVDDEAATVGQDEGVVQADEAAVNTATINLGYTRIVSPIDGKTGPLMIQPGNVITAASSTPLVSITQVQPIKLSFFLPQNQLTQIQNQMQAGKLWAIVPMPGAVGGQEKAKVDFISNAVGANTGTIELRATFANADMRLVPGQNVDVGITMKDIPGAVVVPRDAVNLGPDLAYVYVVADDNTVSSKTVHILDDNGVRDAIDGDVKPGDRVVVEGQLRIVPGAKVQIRNKGPANDSGASDSDMPS